MDVSNCDDRVHRKKEGKKRFLESQWMKKKKRRRVSKRWVFRQVCPEKNVNFKAEAMFVMFTFPIILYKM